MFVFFFLSSLLLLLLLDRIKVRGRSKGTMPLLVCALEWLLVWYHECNSLSPPLCSQALNHVCMCARVSVSERCKGNYACTCSLSDVCRARPIFFVVSLAVAGGVTRRGKGTDGFLVTALAIFPFSSFLPHKCCCPRDARPAPSRMARPYATPENAKRNETIRETPLPPPTHAGNGQTCMQPITPG